MKFVLSTGSMVKLLITKNFSCCDDFSFMLAGPVKLAYITTSSWSRASCCFTLSISIVASSSRVKKLFFSYSLWLRMITWVKSVEFPIFNSSNLKLSMLTLMFTCWSLLSPSSRFNLSYKLVPETCKKASASPLSFPSSLSQTPMKFPK